MLNSSWLDEAGVEEYVEALAGVLDRLDSYNVRPVALRLFDVWNTVGRIARF